MRAWHFGQHTHREDSIIKVINDITGKNFLSRVGTHLINYYPRHCAIYADWGELLIERVQMHARGHVGKVTRGQGERQNN